MWGCLSWRSVCVFVLVLLCEYLVKVLEISYGKYVVKRFVENYEQSNPKVSINHLFTMF